MLSERDVNLFTSPLILRKSSQLRYTTLLESRTKCVRLLYPLTIGTRTNREIASFISLKQKIGEARELHSIVQTETRTNQVSLILSLNDGQERCKLVSFCHSNLGTRNIIFLMCLCSVDLKYLFFYPEFNSLNCYPVKKQGFVLN